MTKTDINKHLITVNGQSNTTLIDNRVNFRFAPCGLVTLTVLLQTFKNSHFTP
ncbi:hypothetical protein HanRHA438_Chr05g0246111 [Helianthus annuus]|uniref:Uncharacterized protein n=1 Tax=Helianthus annuus TaxID=4232 RepID=A0A9K3J4F9_HELAN|nr:hypothetical protein HanXRQr2_Chr05g0236931 [Helianthus annuus]KAJ0920878.1 hypothetical protein HanRHA438_Chr05g0246111 [Helianthus annuus]KAJ0924470.1 hypothetical protein HanPSC8_Chr05g0228521 [Helianthus annuus]